LDQGTTVWLWSGSQSNAFEREKGAELVQQLERERDSVRTRVLTQGDSDSGEFLQQLGGSAQASIAPPHPPVPQSREVELLIYRREPNGELQMVAKGFSANRRSLTSDGVFIVDSGTDVFCWIGHSVAPATSKYALQYAIDYVRKFNRPLWTPLHRVIEGQHSREFQQLLQ